MKQEHLEDQSRSQFNQGIRRSLRNGFFISMISAIIIASISVLNSGLSIGLSIGLTGLLDYGLDGLSFGLDYGVYALSDGLLPGLGVLITGIVVMWALFGGPTVLCHYVVRWLLARHRLFPWHAQAFLDDATNRALL